MTDEQALSQLQKTSRQNTRANYILGEVEQHLADSKHDDRQFREWFTRYLDKYRKGENW